MRVSTAGGEVTGCRASGATQRSYWGQGRVRGGIMGSVFRWQEGEKPADERWDQLAASMMQEKQERGSQLRGL